MTTARSASSDAVVDPERTAFEAVPLVRAADAEVRQRLWEGSRPRTTPAGGTLFVQGDRADALVLLVRGRVRVETVDARGRVRVVGEPSGPVTVDKAGVLGPGRRSGTATAIEDCAWRSLPRGVLDDALGGADGVRDHVLRVLAESSVRSEVAAGPPPAVERLVRWLVTESDRRGTTDLRVSQDDLARVLGVTRLTAHRAVGRLVRDGLVATGYRQVRLVEPGRLRRRLGPQADGGGPDGG